MDSIALQAQPDPTRPNGIVLAGRNDGSAVIVAGIRHAADDLELTSRAGANIGSDGHLKSGHYYSVVDDCQLTVNQTDQYGALSLLRGRRNRVLCPARKARSQRQH